MTATSEHATHAVANRNDPSDESTMEWDAFAARVPPPPNRVTIDATGRTVPRIVARRYRVSTLLGTGGMGAVWLAHDAVLQRAVALKRFSNAEREDGPSALREARAAARISHPGVVRVHDIVLDDDDGDWLVMEALPGAPLSTIMRERGRLPVDEVWRIAVQLVSAVQAIHAVDLVHRDIKPSNIQICGDDRVVLTDFGLSAPSDVGGGLRGGAIAGSLRYMAPESIIDGQFGPPSDMFALGVTLYAAVEGRQPFDRSGEGFLPGSIRSAKLPAPEHAGYLGEVLSGLLESDPARRMDVAAALSHLRHAGPPPRS